MLTVEKAKRMWCPQMSTPDYGDEPITCRADECMWWRWAAEMNVEGEPLETAYDPQGYCGAAGKR